jgi:glyoxylase-like metal-dependent hydrolase (beta-lactamase superfamily II)
MTNLIFLGTKGEIEESLPRHQYHSSLMMVAGEAKLLIDYGMLHSYRLEEIKPDAILITHAHPDHYLWLYQDVATGIPVYLTQETLDYGKFRPADPSLPLPGLPRDPLHQVPGGGLQDQDTGSNHRLQL